MPLGQAGDIPIPAAWFYRGQVDFAVWRPATGEWFIHDARVDRVFRYVHGSQGDIPIALVGCDGPEMTVFRPSDGTWRGRSGAITQYGAPGDSPVPEVLDPRIVDGRNGGLAAVQRHVVRQAAERVHLTVAAEPSA